MSIKVGAQLVARHSTPPSLMLEAPSADQLERMMSLEPIAQVLHMYGHFCNRQMQLHHRDKYITNVPI